MAANRAVAQPGVAQALAEAEDRRRNGEAGIVEERFAPGGRRNGAGNVQRGREHGEEVGRYVGDAALLGEYVAGERDQKGVNDHVGGAEQVDRAAGDRHHLAVERPHNVRLAFAVHAGQCPAERVDVAG